jgi:uncharacterized protein YkwD
MTHALPLIWLLFAAQDPAEVQELVLSEDRAARQRGYAALETLKSSKRSPILKTLKRTAESLGKAYERDVEILTRTINVRSASRGIRTWEREAKKALDAIFDTRRFPNPKKGEVVRAPYKGYDRVMPRVKSALSRYRSSIGRYVDPVLELRPAKYAEELQAKLDRVDEITEVLAKYGKGADKVKRWSDPFWEAIFRFDAGDLKGGVSLYESASLSSTQKKLLFFFYCHGFMKVEKSRASAMNDKEKEGVRLLNVLRMKLGVPPMEADDRLTKAIRGHMADMAKNNYFGHYEKNPATATPHKRCQRQGYKAGTGENIASGGPDRAVDLWMWDGGHFRNMVRPTWKQIGYAVGSKGSGFNAGTGHGVKHPRIGVLWSLPGKK